ncbi:MAG TPA: hypothetical protein VLG28_05580 [Acidimicrobiia bacterium]|nr:hypothetical protein [Acidimicrobiia bacterium]
MASGEDAVREDATEAAEAAAVREPGPIMRVALACQRAADGLAEWTGAISKYMVLITVAVGFINVVLSYTGELTI